MRNRILLFLLLAEVAVPGCSVDVDVILFNSTGRPVVVSVGGHEFEVMPLDSVSFKATELWSGRVSVGQNDRTFHYTVGPSVILPSEYYRTGGWTADVWAQLDPAFRIYLVPIIVDQPGTPSTDQPSGWPLIPEEIDHAA